MGLFSKRRKRKAQAKAEAKALRARAKLEAKLASKNESKQFKALLKADNKANKKAAKKSAKSDKKQFKDIQAQRKHELALARAEAEKAKAGRLNASTVKRYLGVLNVLAPIAIPLVYRGSNAVRSKLDGRRARQLGVSVAELGNYSGPGGQLQARIAGTERSIAEIEARRSTDAEAKKFCGEVRDRLESLSHAVRAGEHMPKGERRRSHMAVSAELDRIDHEVLRRLTA